MVMLLSPSAGQNHSVFGKKIKIENVKGVFIYSFKSEIYDISVTTSMRN
jgi:hypothetical protein